ncbi:TPA: hypothetical protein N0F65_006322 [Lagenidium giganteum]|uniref:SWIM-type domain-containing protein n=1 Tax=Lagenidium giganteum TaxID=4803 RepID=A0AAV2YP13_9STRA|nr:TPA: hypothetical protein N0F65_006322 [Lagenidium giganteum]
MFRKSNITNKDIQNLVQRIKTEVKSEDRNERVKSFLEEFVNTNAGNDVTLCYSVLLVDTTYKTNDLGYKRFGMMIEDAYQFGQHSYVDQETRENLELCVDAFKKNIPSWENVRAIVADKNMNKIRKFGIPSSMENAVQVAVKKMVYDPLKRRYVAVRDQLLSDTRQAKDRCGDARTFKEYFLKTWDACRDSWVSCYRADVVHLGNNTNNRIESAWGKLKPILDRNTELDVALEPEAAFSVKDADLDLRTPSNVNYDENMQFVFQIASRHATELTFIEYKSALAVWRRDSWIESPKTFNFYIIRAADDDEGKTYYVDTNESVCSCAFRTTHLLPCRHLMYMSNRESHA